MSPRTEEELVAELRRGTPEAVQEVRERVRRILGFRGYRIPKADLADLEQEVMSQLWQAVNRPSFDAAKGFWGFVEVVAGRRCIDWLRTKKPVTELTDEVHDGSAGPLRSVLAEERVRLAQAALAELGEPCRELIRLHVGLGKSFRNLRRKTDVLFVLEHRAAGHQRLVCRLHGRIRTGA